MFQRLMSDVARFFISVPEWERVEYINILRHAIHGFSPFREHPVDFIKWVKHSEIHSNNYNPNNVAPPEKRLLTKSLEINGFTQPIVVAESEVNYFEIVDGFHRHQISKVNSSLEQQLCGYQPVVFMPQAQQQKFDRMAATIRHNRARGRHQVNAISDIVCELVMLGWDDKKIGEELGMDSDEVLRLKQITGLKDMFAKRSYSQAWTAR